MRGIRSLAVALALCVSIGLLAACSGAPAAPAAQAEQTTSSPNQATVSPTADAVTQPTPPATPGAAESRRVVVTGQGEASAQPDMVTLRVGVVTEAVSATTALQQNNTSTQAVLDQLTGLGIASDNIQTSVFSISPTYDEPGSDIAGYRVENTVSITMTDLERIGPAIEAAVQAGANQIYGINFGVTNRQQLLAQARRQAIEDARMQAEQYAQAIGATLGPVLLISESAGGPVTPFEAVGRAADIPIQPGTEPIRVSVQVTYALE